MRRALPAALLQEAAEVRGAWKEVADENRSLNRQQHALSEEASRLKERCEVLKQAIGRVNLDLADTNAEAKKLSAEIVEVRIPLLGSPTPSSLAVDRSCCHAVNNTRDTALTQLGSIGKQESCGSACGDRSSCESARWH